MRARVRASQHRAVPGDQRVSIGGYTMSADYGGPCHPDVDGNVFAFVCAVFNLDTQTTRLRLRSSDKMAESLLPFVSDLHRIAKDKTD